VGQRLLRPAAFMAGCLSASAANVRQTDSSVVRRKAEPKLNPKEAARMTASGHFQNNAKKSPARWRTE
jgi:hypothetical protein